MEMGLKPCHDEPNSGSFDYKKNTGSKMGHTKKKRLGKK